MRILAIGKLTGGIRQHVLNLQKNSRTEYVILEYGSKEGKNKVPILDIYGLRALTFLLFGPIIALNLIQKKKIDAIHAHYILPAGLVGAIAAKLSGKKLYITAHGTDVQEALVPAFLKRGVCNQAERTICVSNSLRAELEGIGVKNAVTVYNGTTVESTNKIKLEKPAILFVGALTKNKSGMLNEIIVATKKRIPKVHFYVAGEGKEKIEGARLLGNVPFEKLCSYYNSADALVNCSGHEGFALTVLEAQQAGLPVVARKNSAPEELLSGGRGLFAETPDDFASQLERLIKDRRLRRKVTARARKFAQEYTWEKTARETEKVYAAVERKATKK